MYYFQFLGISYGNLIGMIMYKSVGHICVVLISGQYIHIGCLYGILTFSKQISASQDVSLYHKFE